MHSRLVWLAALATAGVAYAGAPVASLVTSSEQLTIGGQRTSMGGVASWPIAAGDEIVLGGSPGVVTFNDGSRVLLNANSRFVVGQSGSRVTLQLLRGAAAVKLTSHGRIAGVKGRQEGLVFADRGAGGYVSSAGSDVLARGIQAGIEWGMKMSYASAARRPRIVLSPSEPEPETPAPGTQETPAPISQELADKIIAQQPAPGQPIGNNLVNVPAPAPGESATFVVPIPVDGSTQGATFRVDNVNGAMHVSVLVITPDGVTQFVPVPVTTLPSGAPTIVIGF